VDLVETQRILAVVNRHGGRFIEKVFTEGERAYCYACPRPVEHLAARFAAKEAVLKALGTGWSGGIHWSDVEVVREKSGRARIQLFGLALARARALGVAHLHVSLSHTRDLAVAQVVACG